MRPKKKPFIIQKRLTQDALEARRKKYPNFFKQNNWTLYDSFSSEAKMDKAFDELSHTADHEFRKIIKDDVDGADDETE